MSEPDEYLNIEQAARLLNVSETSLRRWTNSGQAGVPPGRPSAGAALSAGGPVGVHGGAAGGAV